MRTRILFIIVLLTSIFFAGAPAATAGEDFNKSDWKWAEIDYTELDFRGIDFLCSGLRQRGATIAILPFTDYSNESLLSSPMGENESAAVRRLCEDLANDFTHMGLLPFPYDDCAAAVEQVAFGDESNEAGLNNSFHMANKTDFLLGAVAEFSPGAFTGTRMGGDGVALTRDQIAAVAEILGADIVIRGSVSEYGMQRKVEANLRTFLPPFLGILNPDKEGMIEVGLYMYDGPSGEMIWAAFESAWDSPMFPMFSTNYDIMSSVEDNITRKLASHLIPPPPPPFPGCGPHEGMGGPCGPGMMMPECGSMGMMPECGMGGMKFGHGPEMGMMEMHMGMMEGDWHGGFGGCMVHPEGHEGMPDHDWDGMCKEHPDGHAGVPQADMRCGEDWEKKCQEMMKMCGGGLGDKKCGGHGDMKCDHGDKKCDGHGEKEKCKEGDEPCEKGDQCCKVTGKKCDDCEKEGKEEKKGYHKKAA